MPDHCFTVHPIRGTNGPYGPTRLTQYFTRCQCGWQSVNVTEALATRQGVTHCKASSN